MSAEWVLWYQPMDQGCIGRCSLPRTVPLGIGRNRRNGDTEMKTAILLVAALFTMMATAEAQTICAFARIVDGDTLVCADSIRVHLLLSDAPELSQAPYGRRAAEVLAEIVPIGSVVELEQDVQPVDRYGRDPRAHPNG